MIKISMKEMCEAGADWVKDWEFNDRDTPRSLYLDGFRAGVTWAQDEIITKLWHEASKEPQAERPILEKVDFLGIYYRVDSFYVGMDWEERVKRFNVVSWCYIDNILPQKI